MPDDSPGQPPETPPKEPDQPPEHNPEQPASPPRNSDGSASQPTQQPKPSQPIQPKLRKHERKLQKLAERKMEREQAKHQQETGRKRKKLMNAAFMGVVILVVAGIGYGAVTLFSPAGELNGLKLPKAGDHWHASYTITLCGEQMPVLPEIPGEVHSHGDNIIHIHPQTVDRAGVNANLKNFLAFYGGSLTNQSVQFPGRPALKNGDSCGNTTGRLQILINGQAHELAERYVMQDGDTVAVAFE